MSTEALGRKAAYPIDSQFLERWSPRAFTGEAMSEQELMTILEAARWAPSSFNVQPWRFIYGIKGTLPWDVLFSLLLPFNQAWAKEAGALIVSVSSSTFLAPGAEKPTQSHSHSFDAGAAWGFLALQAHKLGWSAHAMTGFDIPRATQELGIGTDYRVEALIAVGRKADKSILPERLQAREQPSGRNPISSFAFEGKLR